MNPMTCRRFIEIVQDFFLSFLTFEHLELTPRLSLNY